MMKEYHRSVMRHGRGFLGREYHCWATTATAI
jgi:hypothetical protein